MSIIRRKIIEIDEDLCTGCGQCIVDCAESALQIVDGKARLVADKYCDGLGACLKGCPTGALRIVEREADDFDEKAVEALIHAKKQAEAHTAAKPLGCGCPGTQLKSFPAQAAMQVAGATFAGSGASALTHWPIQIRLVPPTAPFLRNADLLVAADCTAAAYPNFHGELLQGRVLLLGCPKFDDGEAAVQKFTDILTTTPIRSISIAIMEVPCCQNMKHLVAEAFRRSGKRVPAEVVTISAQGQILRQVALD